uniref:DUF4781 domain-containing protein n=1 Tax=Anopheles dirus TaxID=7168 RepID=A0A182NA90_9DIPT
MRQFGNRTGTDRTGRMMLTVSILALAVLLPEQTPKVCCGPATGSTDSGTNDTAPGSHWSRAYGLTALPADDRFYTLEYAPTTIRPRGRSSKTSSGWRREPRFISFETKDNNIEVEIDFAIPFLSIPIKRSVNGVMSSVLKGTPLLNVNLGAVAVAGALTVGGALVGAVARTFTNSTGTGISMPWSSLLPLRGTERAESKPGRDQDQGADQRSEDAADSMLWTLLGSLDRTMERYDIDTVACAQRTVCWYVKEAAAAVAEGKASSVDTIVEGLSRADWIGRFTTGTAVEQAIQAGRQRQTSCEKTFPDCAITSFVEHVVRLARRR